MKATDTKEEAEFRAQVRSWLDKVIPELPPQPDHDDWPARKSYDLGWQQKVFKGGYAGMTWPKEHGGAGRTALHQYIFLEECAGRGAPDTGILTPAMAHVGPVLIARGTPEQRITHLPRILRGEAVWCQGLTEHGAGSDLAAVETTAVADGDQYVLNGRKAWISFAQAADYCEMLVRTGPPGARHRGLAWLMVPMDSRGITVVPVRTMRGEHDTCDIILEDVRVPISWRVGEEDEGWKLIMLTFAFERTLSLVHELLLSGRLLDHIAALNAKSKEGVGSDGVLHEIGKLWAKLFSLKSLARQNLSAFNSTSGLTGIGGSVLKLGYSDFRQRLSDLAFRIAGDSFMAGTPASSPEWPNYLREFMHSMSLPIFAGTSQIQRNLIAERGLGLPREA